MARYPRVKEQGRVAAVAAREWMLKPDYSSSMRAFARQRNVNQSLFRRYVSLLRRNKPLPTYLDVLPVPSGRADRAVSMPPGLGTSQRSCSSNQFSIFIEGDSTRVACRWCRWDDIYTPFRMEDHRKECQNSRAIQPREQSVPLTHSHHVLATASLQSPHQNEAPDEPQQDPEPVLALSVQIPSNVGSTDHQSAAPVRAAELQPPSALELSYKFLHEFDSIRARRFHVIQGLKTQLQDAWMTAWMEYQDWHSRTEAKIAETRENGHPEVASELAQRLSAKEFNYGDFKIVCETPLGDEIISVTGISPADSKTRRPASHCSSHHNPSAGTRVSVSDVLGRKIVEGSDDNPKIPDRDGDSHGLTSPTVTAHSSATSLSSTHHGSDNGECVVCGTEDHGDILFLCDSCDKACHSCCVGSEHLPEGDWLCIDCCQTVDAVTQTLNGDDFSAFLGDFGEVDDSSPDQHRHKRVDIGTVKFQKAVAFSETRRNMLWINISQNGVAFCLSCDCHKIIIPSPSPSKATHSIMPSFFRRDPFGREDRLEHFRLVHNEPQPLTIQEAILKYGRQGIPQTSYTICPIANGDAVEFDDDIGIHDQCWQVTAHNNLVEKWCEQMDARWKKVLDQSGPHIRLLTNPPSRSILASAIAGSPAHVFRWPNTSRDRWILVCPYPGCYADHFDGTPRLGASLGVARHFQEHDSKLGSLKPGQLVALFGVRGKFREHPCMSLSNAIVVINDTGEPIPCGQGRD